MNSKQELMEHLYWRASHGELDVDGERLQGVLSRDPDVKGALARILREASNQAEGLVGADVVNDAVRVTRLQGVILGMRAAVEMFLNSAYERSNDASED